MRGASLALALLLSPLAAFADVQIDHLLYSLDGGRTWSEDVPVLEGGARKFDVKVEWSGKESRPSQWSGLVSCHLQAKEDFASALAGGPKRIEDGEGFSQTGAPTFFSRGDPPFLLSVDLGERKEGVLGERNKWDEEKRVHVSAPLPAVPARAPGAWRFIVVVDYHLLEAPPGGSRRVFAFKSFEILIRK